MTTNAATQNKPERTVLTRCDLLLSEDEFVFPGILVGSAKKGMSPVALLGTVFVVGANGKVGACGLNVLVVILLVPEDEELEVVLPGPGSLAVEVELVTVALATEVVGSRLIKASGRRAGRTMR